MKRVVSLLVVFLFTFNALSGVTFAAADKTITISPGQSYMFVNNSSSGSSVFETGTYKYESASYKSSGAIDYLNYQDWGSTYIPEYGHAIITVPSTSRAISFRYDNSLVTVRASSSTAMKKVVIQPGSSYEFENISSADETIRQSGKDLYDYISYKNDGKIDGTSVDTWGSLYISAGGRLIVTVPSSSKAITFYTGLERYTKTFTGKSSANPAFFKATVQAGSSYEFTNNGSTDEYIRAKNYSAAYDVAFYKNDGTLRRCYVSSAGGEVLSAGERMVITINSDYQIFYIPYETYSKSFTSKEVSNPAVYKTTIDPGSSYEFINNGPNDETIYESGQEVYESALYKKDGSLSTCSDSDFSSQYIPSGGRLVITVPSVSDSITFYTGYDLYTKNLTSKVSDNPAIYKTVVLPGQSYEFKNIGTDYETIRQSGDEKYKYAEYGKDGSMHGTSESYSGMQFVSSGWKVVVSVPTTANAIVFYSGFDSFKKSFDPSIVPFVQTFLYKQLNSAKDKNEVMNVLKASYALIPKENKQNDNVKEYSVQFAENAIKKISSQTMAVSNSTAEIKVDSIKDQIQKAKDAKPEVEQVLQSNGIEKNRDIKTSVELDIQSDNPSVSMVINKDLAQSTSDIDNISLNTGDVGISIETSKLTNEFGTDDQLTISVDKTAEVPTTSYYGKILATTTNNIGPILAESASPKQVKINFKSKNGTEIKSLKSNVGVELPVSGGNPEYNCVFMVDGDKTEAVGGQYNPSTNKLSIKTNKAASYYVVENKKTFNDIGKKDPTMKKAIEIMAAKGIISGKGVDQFDPDASIDRSEFAKLIIKAIYKFNNNASVSFTDVPKSSWFYPYVACAKAEGLINGYPDKTFKPKSVINKQEITKICASVLNNEKGYYFPTDTAKYLKFNDSDKIPDWAEKFIALANREGLVVKRQDGKFIGDQVCTRGDAAIILYKLFNRL